jgi:hypothetical protein
MPSCASHFTRASEPNAPRQIRFRIELGERVSRLDELIGDFLFTTLR